MKTDQAAVFLSYPRVRKKWVEEFKNRFGEELEGQCGRVNIWFDKTHLDNGASIDAKTREGAAEADIFLCVLCHPWLQSTYCEQEAKAFLRSHGRDTDRFKIISIEDPVRLINHLPPPLKNRAKAPAFFEPTDGGGCMPLRSNLVTYQKAIADVVAACKKILIPDVSEDLQGIFITGVEEDRELVLEASKLLEDLVGKKEKVRHRFHDWEAKQRISLEHEETSLELARKVLVLVRDGRSSEVKSVLDRCVSHALTNTRLLCGSPDRIKDLESEFGWDFEFAEVEESASQSRDCVKRLQEHEG